MERTAESSAVKRALWFYRDEIKDCTVYGELGRTEQNEETGKYLLQLSEMEKGHAVFWKGFLAKLGAGEVSYRYPSYKLLFIKFIRKIFGLSLVIRIFERGEENVIREYREFLQSGGLEKHDSEQLHRIVIDEILHEDYFANQLVGMSGRLESVRDVFYGMSDGLVEVLAAVAGLEPVVKTHVLVAAGGLVVGISGTLSMAIGAYMSTKAHMEIEQRQSDRVAREIDLVSHEEKVGRLKELLHDMGFKGDYTEDAARSIASEGNNATDFFVRNKLGRSRESSENPRKAGLQTGLFYLIGSAFPILPFAFIGGLVGLAFSVIAVVLAQMTAATIIAISSDTSIFRKVSETVGLTIGAAAATFIIGTLLFTFLKLPTIP